ncbi:MAG: M3 family metallopeptidase [Bacteroidales bacterium]
MKKIILSLLMVGTLFMLTSCNKNPLLVEWNTPYGIPPFEQVKVENYMPAFTEALAEHDNEIKAIVNSKEEATFENTVEALEFSGDLLSRVSSVFYSNQGVNSSDAIMKIATKLSPMISTHYNDINFNEKLFQRIKTVYNKRKDFNLDAQQMRLTEETYKNFVRSGIDLPTDKKAELKLINSKLSALQLEFEQHLLKETANYKLVISDEKDLAGLSEAQIAEAANRAKAAGEEGKWYFGLDNPSIMPFLESSAIRKYRIEILNAYLNRGNNDDENDNKEIVKQLVDLRIQKAHILGYENYASYVLEDRMAKNSKNVYNLLDEIWTPALKVAKEELKDITKAARKDGMTDKIQAADWRYYFAKAKAAKYNLSEEEMKPYFKLENVRKGIFYVANKLYGLTFTKLENVPLPNPEAVSYDVTDIDGNHIGVFFMDMFARPGHKNGGAWCSAYREAYYKGSKRIAPLVNIVGNFSRPIGDKPALLTADETETMFHEFGHALQGLLSQVHYKSLGNITRDFVELPAQLDEHWAFEPEVLAVYAKHYKTEEVIPDELVNKMKTAGKYGQGFATVEYLAASYLDMDYHVLSEMPANLDVNKFEEKVLSDKGLNTSIIPPRYRSTYFHHTMGGGYTAGYYSYIWAGVLDCDAFQAFQETGDIFNQEVAGKFRKYILESCGAEDADVLYVKFRGHQPGTEALLENRGLNK